MTRVFVITPFEADSAGHEDPRIFAAVQQAIVSAGAMADVELVHPKQKFGAGSFWEEIQRELKRADVVIAVLTGGNRNVFFEVGFHLGATNRPSILIVDCEANVPSDLRHWRYLTYGGEGELESLAARLAESIKQSVTQGVIQDWTGFLTRAQKQSGRFWEHARGTAQSKESKKPYIPELYVPRASAEEQLQAFVNSQATAAILVGSSGYGLTNLLCHWMEERSANGDCVVAYNCAPWIHQYIEQEVGADFDASNREELLAAFDRIAALARAQSRMFIVVFEHFDQFSGGSGARSLLLQIDALADGIARSGMGVRFIVSCPVPAWEQMKRLEVTEDLRMSLYFRPADRKDAIYLDRFSPEEFEAAYNAYKKFFRLSTDLIDLPFEVRERLRNPFMLRLLAEACESQSEPIRHEAQVLSVFQRYYEKRIRRSDRAFIEALAKEMLDRRQSSLSLSDFRSNEKLDRELRDEANSAYYRSLSSGLLTETGDCNDEANKQVTFTHLQIGAYVLASYLRGRLISKEEQIDFVLQQARATPMGWYAARILLSNNRELFGFFARSEDIELRELAIEGLIQLYGDQPTAALALMKELLQLDVRQARQTALKAAYNLGAGAHEIFSWAANQKSRALRDAASDALYLIWQSNKAGADFTTAFLRQLAGPFEGVWDALTGARKIRFFIGLTIAIYINHCDNDDVKQLMAELYSDFLKKKLKLNRTGALPEYFSSTVAGVFSKPILDAMLLGHVAADAFFAASAEEKARFKDMIHLLDPNSDPLSRQDDLQHLLNSELPPLNILGALVLAIHACSSFEKTEPLLRRLFESSNEAGRFGRLWIVASFSLLMKDTPQAWTELLQDFTTRLIAENPEIFYGERSPLSADFEVIMLPLGLACAKQGGSIPHIENLLRDGLRRDDTKLVCRCIAGLGAVGFYYPKAVFHTLRAAGIDFRSAALQEALVSALATIHTLHMDAVDALLDTVGASEGLRRRVAANANSERVRNYVFLIGFYNNAVHQALKYPKMRRQLLMHSLHLLAEARSPKDFVAGYVADSIRMARDVDYNLIRWTTED
jgi:hypothetical protein